MMHNATISAEEQHRVRLIAIIVQIFCSDGAEADDDGRLKWKKRLKRLKVGLMSSQLKAANVVEKGNFGLV